MGKRETQPIGKIRKRRHEYTNGKRAKLEDNTKENAEILGNYENEER